MVLNKIFGAVLFILGSILLFALWYAKDYTMVAFEMIAGPTLIYLGLVMLNYL